MCPLLRILEHQKEHSQVLISASHKHYFIKSSPKLATQSLENDAGLESKVALWIRAPAEYPSNQVLQMRRQVGCGEDLDRYLNEPERSLDDLPRMGGEEGEGGCQ